MELSVEIDDFEVHILGYLFDYLDQEFLNSLAEFRAARRQRAELMIERLRNLGLEVDLEKYFPTALEGSVGRLHIARAMYLSGQISTIREAFSRYIGNNAPAYVPKLTFPLKEAIGTIRRLGGISVLAHPGQLKRDNIIPRMVEMGLGGLEAYYPTHSQFEINHYSELASYYGLVITGGSDCHGRNKDEVVMGKLRTPYQVLEK